MEFFVLVMTREMMLRVFLNVKSHYSIPINLFLFIDEHTESLFPRLLRIRSLILSD